MVAPFKMNRKDFAVFRSLESHYDLLNTSNLISGLLKRPMNNHNTMTLIVLLTKMSRYTQGKSTVKLLGATV